MNAVHRAWLCAVMVLCACAPQRPVPAQDEESPTRGSVELLCDDAVAPLLQAPLRRFDSLYPDAKVQLRIVSAREAMRQLLARTARLIVVARDYLPDEDSLMRLYGVPAHQRVKLAEDALVFFAHPSVPLDTLNVAQLRAILLAEKEFRDYFRSWPREPELVCPSTASSVYAQLVQQVLGGTHPRRRLRLLPTADSVLAYVTTVPWSIGVGYLSQTAHLTSIRAIELGYIDSAGTYVSPKPVHQSYVLLRKYPYVVPIYAYLRDDLRNLAWTVATFLGTDAEVQRHFLQRGIVPAFARIRLVPEE
ncbi:MAG: substrate-binding domain-containing protein [Chlorobiota bacterium]